MCVNPNCEQRHSPTRAATPSTSHLPAMSYFEIQVAPLSQRMAWLEQQLRSSLQDHRRTVCPERHMKNDHTRKGYTNHNGPRVTAKTTAKGSGTAIPQSAQPFPNPEDRRRPQLTIVGELHQLAAVDACRHLLQGHTMPGISPSFQRNAIDLSQDHHCLLAFIVVSPLVCTPSSSCSASRYRSRGACRLKASIWRSS